MVIHRPTDFGLRRFSGVYLWAFFILLFGVWKPELFLTQSTLHSVAAAQAVPAMLALALLVPLTAGAYDLSVGAVINFSTVLVVILQTKNHMSMGWAIAVTIFVCLAIGAASGFFVVVLRVNSFVATLGIASVVAAFQVIISGQTQPFPPINSSWTALTQHQVLGFQIVVLYLIVLAMFLWWVLDHTPVGRNLYAIGGNAEAARLAGVRVPSWTFLTLVVSAGISGIAGIFYASQSGPSLTFGQTLLLPAFAAAFLGSTQINPGRYNVWGTVLAVYVLATGVQGFQYVTGAQWLSDMFNGIALLAAVSFAVWRQKPKVRRRPPQMSGAPASANPSEQGEFATPRGRESKVVAVGDDR
jgi:ribose transport system permease protein